jgi:CspA family cold shock protein
MYWVASFFPYEKARMSNELQQGTIVFYAAAKQFGFIKPDIGEGDVFFHIEQYDHDGDPAIDSRVAFMVEPDPRREGRRRAKAVTPIQNSQTVPAPGHV